MCLVTDLGRADDQLVALARSEVAGRVGIVAVVAGFEPVLQLHARRHRERRALSSLQRIEREVVVVVDL